MTVQYEIRSGAYYDSVVLMQLQRALLDLDGVQDAGVVMATPANKDLLQQSDLLPDDASDAGPDDLLIVVKADDAPHAQDALSQVDDLLTRRRSGGDSTYRPRSLSAAVKQLPDARWVLVSVPGRYAADVSREALEQGKHVFLYSDNVSIEDELALKQEAASMGLLVMGPDCGTAIINGIGLGFANRVDRGPIGLVAASGTGLQAVTSEIHRLGSGITHAIGTGGRDLKGDIGAITMLQGVELLANDPDTNVIVLVSKPPDPQIAAKVLQAAKASGKPVVVNFLGYAPPADHVGNLHFEHNLYDAAAKACELADHPHRHTSSEDKTTTGYLRGLFSGGTLASDVIRHLALFVLLKSNVPQHATQALDDPTVSEGHCILDLGEDVFTVGRLHPMMDNDLRIRRLRQEAAEGDVSLILLDVVLGEGAHPDPAGELAPVIAEVIKEHGVQVAAFVIGTDDDPQDMDAQIEALREAGADITLTTAETAAWVFDRIALPVDASSAPPSLDDLNADFAAINVGVETFYDSLTGQGADAVQVDWRPPAGGNEQLAAILAKMKSNN